MSRIIRIAWNVAFSNFPRPHRNPRSERKKCYSNAKLKEKKKSRAAGVASIDATRVARPREPPLSRQSESPLPGRRTAGISSAPRWRGDHTVFPSARTAARECGRGTSSLSETRGEEEEEEEEEKEEEEQEVGENQSCEQERERERRWKGGKWKEDGGRTKEVGEERRRRRRLKRGKRQVEEESITVLSIPGAWQSSFQGSRTPLTGPNSKVVAPVSYERRPRRFHKWHNYRAVIADVTSVFIAAPHRPRF